jgi:Flp pilus assembly protein TadG
VEFALTAPVFFFVLIATLNVGLLLFTVNAAGESANIGMITLADEGTAATADTDAITALTTSGLGATSLGSIDQIDIYELEQCTDGTASPNLGVACPSSFYGVKPVPQTTTNYYNTFCYNGSSGCTASDLWLPSTGRSDSVSAGVTNIGLTIRYHFNYFGLGQPAIHLTVTRYFRVEPRTP